MGRVKRVFYRDGDDDIPAEENPSTFRMDALVVEFTCPVCGEGQRHETDASPPNDERHVCSSCGNDYFLFPVKRKGESRPLSERIAEQLESVAVIHPIASEQPQVVREASFAALYGATALLPVVIGVALNILLTILVFRIASARIAGLVAVSFLILQSSLAVFGGLVGPVRFLYRWVYVYRRLDGDVSFIETLEHAGNYYHNDPYSFQK